MGREIEIAQLDDCYRRARRGERQIVFVTGEVGIGKSTLIQAWLERFGIAEEAWVGSGQCVEHTDAGEAYLCLLEALSRLCRGPQAATAMAVLRQHAPGWISQLPVARAVSDQDAFDPVPPPVAAGYYQREVADALEALGALRPVVLVLEDLHWCDAATVEALAVIARRPESTRLLLIATSRPGELAHRRHPLRSLKQELAWHGQCRELPLTGLDEFAIRSFVSQRLPTSSDELATTIYRRTAGQPLFVVSLITSLMQRQDLIDSADAAAITEAAGELPTELEQLIESQIQRLDAAEREILEAGSIAGPTFAASTVAGALGLPDDQVEQTCGELARRQRFIVLRGPDDWPDGTSSETYAFRHELYQEALYRRVGINRKIRLHRTIGERLARAYGPEAAQLAIELAEHFELGRAPCRAIRYRRLAAQIALNRSAPHAARSHLERALELIAQCPRDSEATREELRVQLALGVTYIATDGFGTPEVARIYHRAHALCRQLPTSTELAPVLSGLWNFYLTRADLRQARVVATEVAGLIGTAATDECLTPMHNLLGQTELFSGEPADALQWITLGLAGYDPSKHRELASRYGEDPGVVCHMYASLVHWLLGNPDQAVQHIDEGLRLAQDLGQPFGVAQMHWAAMLVAQGRGDPEAVKVHSAELIALCERESIPYWAGGGHVLQGWANSVTGSVDAGVASIRRGLAEWDATGSALIRPYYLALLAQALAQQGDLENAIATVGEALQAVQTTGERWYEAELHRLEADLALRGKRCTSSEIETILETALDIARGQRAAALELRIVVDLVQLWITEDRRAEAGALLDAAYRKVAANGETVDSTKAAALLIELAATKTDALALR